MLGLLAAAPAAAQKASSGQVAYVEGLRAFDVGDYAVAAARMRTALSEDAVEATAKFRYRAQNAEDYFPHLWLGLSLEKLGDADGARRSLGESRGQGAVRARPALERILGAALARLTPPTPLPTPSPTPLPSIPAVLAPVPVEAFPGPTATPARLATPAPRVPTIAMGGMASSAPTRAAAATVSPASADDALRSGLRAFFRGNYEGAESLLAPEAARSPVARLFLAWSLGGRYLLTGSRDAALLSRARAEHDAALRAGAPFTGEPWVSPAILALFGAPDVSRWKPTSRRTVQRAPVPGGGPGSGFLPVSLQQRHGVVGRDERH